MNTFYVKELSRLTKVSIRTLHYYDKIGLLKPSERLTNGYRVYSENDLQKLEKIIALKFLGFTLARIEQLTAQEQGTLELLEKQSKLLQSEVTFLQVVQGPLLLSLIQEYKHKKSIDWHAIANIIVTYTKEREELPRTTLLDKRQLESSDLEIWQKLITKISTLTEQENS